MLIKVIVVWDVTRYRVVNSYRRVFVYFILEMKAVLSFGVPETV